MLGAELRRARLAAGLTQDELAYAANLHRTYVSQLERDLKSPTVDSLFRLCAAMNIRASHLLARVEKRRKTD